MPRESYRKVERIISYRRGSFGSGNTCSVVTKSAESVVTEAARATRQARRSRHELNVGSGKCCHCSKLCVTRLAFLKICVGPQAIVLYCVERSTLAYLGRVAGAESSTPQLR